MIKKLLESFNEKTDIIAEYLAQNRIARRLLGLLVIAVCIFIGFIGGYNKGLSSMLGNYIPEATVDTYQLERKIDDLIRNGFLRGIENDGGYLIIDAAEAAPAPPEQTSPPPMTTIQKIRWLNDEIDDAAVSARIDQIEAITAGILRTVREKPERAGIVEKFMDYYLPTTLKLLESYRLMEDQPYQGENIQAARERIEDVLGKLVTAMEAQQERLFSAEAADVAAEIEALEKMMAADGLGESQMFRR